MLISNISRKEANNTLKLCIIFELFLVAMYLIGALLINSWTIDSLFDLNQEGNIPSWFSSTQLFLVGFMLWAGIKKINSELSSRFLKTLGLVFFFLSIDEAAELHETFSFVAKKIIPNIPSLSSHGHGVWMYIYLLGFFLFIIFTYKNFITLLIKYKNETKYCIYGAILLFAGAIGIETIQLHWKLEQGLRTINIIQVSVEEFLEMLGVSFILYGVLLLRIKNEQ